jgi:hypothetical protein
MLKVGNPFPKVGRWALFALFAIAAAGAWGAEAIPYEGRTQITGQAIIIWLVWTVIGIVITAGWYWIGARLFGYRPIFGSCLMAAVIPPILFFFLYIAAVVLFGVLACLNIYLGVLVLIVVLIYLLVLYIRWVATFLEIDSMGVAFLLVFLPVLFNIILSYFLRAGEL